MKRVLLLVTDLQRGGTPMRVVRWARWLPRIHVEPVVGCLAPAGPLSTELERLGIAHFACEARHRFDLGLLRRLSRKIARFDPDIVHSFLFHANLAARLVGRLDRSRPVITSTATIEIERRWHRWLRALASPWPDLHTVNAPAVARHVVDDLGISRAKVVVVPNGIDIAEIDAQPTARRSELGLPSDVPLVIWAGRMDPVKGLETWIRVFEEVGSRRRICGLLLGDGPIRPEIEQILRERGLYASADMNGAAAIGRVRVAGWREDVVPWLKAADVLLFPSRTEGNSNVVIEAMAAGCCVVASRVGGCCDLIRSGESGWLCQPGAVGDFVERVILMLESGSRRREMGTAARQVILQRESPDTVLGRLAQIYGTS